MRGRRLLALGVAALAAVWLVPTVANSVTTAPPNRITFPLFINPGVGPCVNFSATKTAHVNATVLRNSQNDSMTLHLGGFKPGLDFDLFTVQRSNQDATGAPAAGFTSFGLAWYQSDIHIGSKGTGSVTVKTILLDQIFGFDPDVALAPTNTFHVGFWFNDPHVPFDGGCEAGHATPIVTPFNGEHQAGPLAFITRPDATTGLGPLCTNPNGAGGCIP